MSLATFKKKSINSSASATKRSGKSPGGIWQNTHYGPSGFSINGGRRSITQGTSMAMSQSGTRYRGIHPIGYGGNKGRYVTVPGLLNMPPVKAEIGASQAAFIKHSVLSTKGMITKKYPWIQNGQYPYSVTQPNYTGYQTDSSSQGVYLDSLSSKNDCHSDVNNSAKYVGNTSCGGPAGCERTSTAGYTYNLMAGNAPYSKQLGIPQTESQHLLKVKQQCVNPSEAQKPFPYQVSSGIGLLRGGLDSYRVGTTCMAAPVVR